MPDRPEYTIRIEAAAANGQPVYFALAGSWSESAREVRTPPSRFAQAIGSLASVIMPALMVLGAVLARGNIKAGRGDRDGALRVATFVFATALAAWVLGASHIEAVGIEIGRVFGAIGRGLFEAGILWVTYLGLEPYVRRHAPDSILGWTKLVAGHWRDPRVGVDVLVGVSAGLAMTVLYAVHNVLPALAGFLEPMPLIPNETALIGVRHIFAGIAGELADAVVSGMLGVAGVVGFVLLLRSRVLAVLAAIVCFTPVVINGMFPGSTPWLDIAIGAGIITIFILTIVRAGLLSAVAALFTHFVLLRAPITTDLSSWHAPVGLWHVGIVLVAGLGACYYARNGVGEKVRTS